MPGIVQGEGSCEITSYKLPVCDTDTERRNFEGYQTHTPGEALMNAISAEGHTDKGGVNNASKGEARALKRNFK